MSLSNLMTTDHNAQETALSTIAPGKLMWLFAVLLFIVLPQTSKAGHASGVDITYECISSCTIRINFKAYRNCATTIPTISPVNSLSINAAPGCNAPTQIGAWLNVGTIEVTPVCPGTATLCNTPNAPLSGVTEHSWIGDFDFCSANCTDYEVSWAICCRNSSISTLISPQTSNIYVSTHINPLLTPCNNSPAFDNPPTPYICQGQSYIFSQGATDPDGDSLAYRLGPCLTGNNQSVSYFNWISPQQPLGPDWDIQLDSITGDLSIQPNPTGPNPGSLQVGVLCVYVEEWRDSVLINTIQRDVQLTVIPCPNNTQPTIPGALNVTGGTANGFQVSTCYGQSLCWYIRAIDPDVGQTQTIIWDESLKSLGATLTLAGNPTIQDTIVGTNQTAEFCWTPPAPGNYSFVVTITDDACPLYGFNQYTFSIYVSELQIQRLDTTLTCDQAGICALPLTGTAPYTFNWSGSGISTSDSCFVQNFPGPGFYPYQLSVSDSAGCITTIDDTLELVNNVDVNAGPDSSACAGQAYVLGDSLPAPPHWVYIWSPATHLDDSSLPHPTLTPVNTSGLPEQQSFSVMVIDTMTNCIGFDTVVLTVNPLPSATFLLPPEACVDEKVTIPYAGGSTSAADFNWNFTNGNTATATGVGPHKISWPVPGTHEVNLTVSQYGCTSTVFVDSILVHPIPVAQIDSTAEQCFDGHSFNLYALGSYGPSAIYDWNYGNAGSAPVDSLAFLDSLTFSLADTHLVTLQITENGCVSNLDSAEVILIPNPEPDWSFTSGQQCFPANTFDFFPVGNNDSSATYQWSFQDGNPPASSTPNTTVSFLSQGPKSVSLEVSAFGCTSILIDTIDVYPSPLAVAGADTSMCEGTIGVELPGQVVGGNAPFNYQWWHDPAASFSVSIDSLTDDDPQVESDSSVWIYLQVTDVNGCISLVDSLWLQVLPKPQIDAGNDTSVCKNGPCVSLNPSFVPGQPLYWQWSPAAGLNNPNTLTPCAAPDSTTTYTVLVTNLVTGCRNDAGGVDSSAQITVEVIPQPLVEGGPDFQMCPGDTAILLASGTGSNSSISYQWSPSSGLSSATSQNPIATPPLTTTYTVTPFANGCQGISDTVRVFVHALPIADAGQDQEICLGESVRLNGTAGGDSTATYSFDWSGANLDNPGAEDPWASPAATTTYYITAISNYGCESPMDSVTVHLRPTPVAIAGDSAFVCLGNPLTLQGNYYFTPNDSGVNLSQLIVNWSPGQMLSDSSELNPTLVPGNSGWYHLDLNYVTCTSEDSVYVTVIPGLNPLVRADTSVACEGDSVQLSAFGGIQGPAFEWSPAASLSDPNSASPMAAPDSSTWYTVYLKEFGCTDSARVFLEILPRPEAIFTHTDAVGCPPLEVEFTATTAPGNFLVWNWGDGSPAQNQNRVLHRYENAGDYPVQLIAIGAGGCADTSDFLEVNVIPPPRLDGQSNPAYPAELVLWNGGQRAEIALWEEGNEAIQWIWTAPNGQQFDGAQLNYGFETAGTYFFELAGTNAIGCWSDTIVGPFVVVEGSVDIPNVFTPNADGINDVFLPDLQINGPYLLSIFDRWGSLIFETNNVNQAWEGHDHNGRPVPAGTYFYRIKANQKSYSGSIDLVR